MLRYQYRRTSCPGPLHYTRLLPEVFDAVEEWNPSTHMTYGSWIEQLEVPLLELLELRAGGLFTCSFLGSFSKSVSRTDVQDQSEPRPPYHPWISERYVTGPDLFWQPSELLDSICVLIAILSVLLEHDMIRNIAGYGEGRMATRIPYKVLTELFSRPGPLLLIRWSYWVEAAGVCNKGRYEHQVSLPGQIAFGVTIASESSGGCDDCDSSQMLRTLQAMESRDLFLDSLQWNNAVKGFMDSSWLLGSQLGLQYKWIPTDSCTAGVTFGVAGPQFDGVDEAYQTGGPGLSRLRSPSYDRFPPSSNMY
ncbi:hypothetical protein DFJ58DRAFT_912630 [Suillus subalutaceus]|uniref:uncharacterized protein n=1 Tax=Suillus subalutaceus TaxID=48586 RepID=UPI001B8862DB|nr:uncharacterized protein DFJ58DRAFT_912630 [Suillus subalutaceus]KAG1862062.1 hypothetical protein DFJ58DRAFT_912630 [Suillus subalutaceus]